jgi:hypothetical protein
VTGELSIVISQLEPPNLRRPGKLVSKNDFRNVPVHEKLRRVEVSAELK